MIPKDETVATFRMESAAYVSTDSSQFLCCRSAADPSTIKRVSTDGTPRLCSSNPLSPGFGQKGDFDFHLS